ncbi:lysophosphatidylcholine acyltransferase 2 isoform X2 [Pelobates fuscus]|uniref:lysophosphatidylcholine acyltransferase 2 isoform X2 n=1 Tax=Pelobates fuscus TaxID=191477 RepID=UPI002FE45EA6
MVLHQRIPLLPRQKSFIPPQIPNPFVHELCLTHINRVNMVFCGLLLLPVRIIFFIVVLILAWLVALFTTCCSEEKIEQPFTGWRRNVSKCLIGFFGRLLYFCMGFHVRIQGNPARAMQAPILVVAPHSSFFDGVAVIASRMPSTVSREENVTVPIFGRILRALQPVLVSRVDPNSRKNTINEIKKRAMSGGEWPQVLMFPEGTCTNRSCLISFKPGAFLPGVPVQPVILRYPNTLDTVTWTWQGYSATKLLLMTFCQIYTIVEVEFLPVYVPCNEEKNDPFLFANNVRHNMAQALGLPVTEHTFEDCRLMLTARELTLPMEAGLVEFTKVSRKLHLKWDNVMKQMEVFATIAASSKGGRIGIEEFASHLKLPESDILRELFTLFDRLFDVDEDGSITEDEFSSLLQSSLGIPDLDVSKLFKDIDIDKSGKISYDEFKIFSLKNPEYAKLFTTYLEHQRYYYMLQEDQDQDRHLKICAERDVVHSATTLNLHHSTSEKKED